MFQQNISLKIWMITLTPVLPLVSSVAVIIRFKNFSTNVDGTLLRNRRDRRREVSQGCLSNMVTLCIFLYVGIKSDENVLNPILTIFRVSSTYSLKYQQCNLCCRTLWKQLTQQFQMTGSVDPYTITGAALATVLCLLFHYFDADDKLRILDRTGRNGIFRKFVRDFNPSFPNDKPGRIPLHNCGDTFLNKNCIYNSIFHPIYKDLIIQKRNVAFYFI